MLKWTSHKSGDISCPCCRNVLEKRETPNLNEIFESGFIQIPDFAVFHSQRDLIFCDQCEQLGLPKPVIRIRNAEFGGPASHCSRCYIQGHNRSNRNCPALLHPEANFSGMAIRWYRKRDNNTLTVDDGVVIDMDY
tara:strand:+ start:89 stop:496 length:408 start_codon:yes stop_codon:yes gene_type:complete